MEQLNLFTPQIVLGDYDLVVVNSSGGKDSICALWKIIALADKQEYDRSKIVVSHQDLGESDWQGVPELVQAQADRFGVKVCFSKRRNKDGKEETLLEYALRRGKWPSNKQRWCTSGFKTEPGDRVLRALTKDMGKCRVLYVFGFRAEESPRRSKRAVYELNTRLSTQKREVFNWLPIHSWTNDRVWATIKANNLPYHPAYDLGMPRLSCVFCIFSPFDALVIAGRANPELLDRYVEVEKTIGHKFRQDCSLESVKRAVEEGYRPSNSKNWVM